MDDLQVIDREITDLQGRLDRLETARQVIIEIRGAATQPAESKTVAATPVDPARSLRGVTIVVAAKAVLEDAKGKPLHYRAIAKEAARRGYELGSSSDSGYASFRRTMLKRRDVFVREGEGEYRLKDPLDDL